MPKKATPLAITIDDEINELKRELRLREKVYPGQIGHGKMKRADARRQWQVLNKTIKRL